MKLDSAVFYTNDLEKIVDFYANQLGLKTDYIQEGHFASFLFENGVKLGIKQAVDERELPGKQAIIISVREVEKLYDSFKQKDFTIYEQLEDADWGVYFSILDPEGNKVEFLRRK